MEEVEEEGANAVLSQIVQVGHQCVVNGVSVRLQTSQMGTLMLASAVLHQTVQTGHLPARNGDTAKIGRAHV